MNRKFVWIILIPVLLCLCGGAALATWGGWLFLARPQPSPARQELYSGVEYRREVRQDPRPMVVHTLLVDLRDPGITLLVTPGNPEAERPLQARTTRDFLQEFDLQLAVNGDGFTPWWSNTIIDYYPHSGDPVSPVGYAASRGTVYSLGSGAGPTLYISRNNRARFNTPIGGVYNAISGNLMLVAGGKALAEQIQGAEMDTPQPRTAVGLDKSGRRLIIVVVDGRQPNYSQGATLPELAEILIAQGAYHAMNMDGGGSSTLVAQGGFGGTLLLNTPIDHRIPGRERPVGNHLGIRAAPLGGN